ncbi:hypothetical protein KXV96_002271, partial [Aspergillus fumigatus]
IHQYNKDIRLHRRLMILTTLESFRNSSEPRPLFLVLVRIRIPPQGSTVYVGGLK